MAMNENHECSDQVTNVWMNEWMNDWMNEWMNENRKQSDHVKIQLICYTFRIIQVFFNQLLGALQRAG